VVNELRGEKVDVVQWRDDIGQFIAEALGPAKVKEVHISEAEKTADVVVSEHQLSLAIGKEGQNARLAARLSGYKVDIRSDNEGAEPEAEVGPEPEATIEGEPVEGAIVEEAAVEEPAPDEAAAEETAGDVAIQPAELVVAAVADDEDAVADSDDDESE
jgi:N utilization substance protein A